MPLQLEEIADLDLEPIEDESPPPPRFNDELIAALPERDRRQLELRSELAAERGRGEKLQAETEELARQEASIERFTPTGILNQPERFMRTFGGAANAPEMPERFQAGQPVFPIEAPQGTNAMAGLGQLGVGLLNTLQTPEMIVIAPAMINPVGRALMGMEMGKEIPGQIERGAQTLGDITSTPAEQVVAVGEPVIATGMTTLISRTPSGKLTEKAKLKIARDTGQEFGEPLVFPPGRRQIEIPQEVKQTLPKAAAAAEEAVVKGQDVQKAEAKAPVEEGAGVELRQEAPAQEAPLKPRLVPVLVKDGKVLGAGMSHTEAARDSRAIINAERAKNEINDQQAYERLNAVQEALDDVDAGHGMLDLNTGKVVELGPGRVQSPNLNPKETAANLRELQDKGIAAPKAEVAGQVIDRINQLPVEEAVKLNQRPEMYRELGLKPEDAPALQKASDNAFARFEALLDAGNEAAAQAEMGRGVFFNGAIEWANKKGPNYERGIAETTTAKEAPSVEVGLQQEAGSGLPESKISSEKGGVPNAKKETAREVRGESPLMELQWQDSRHVLRRTLEDSTDPGVRKFLQDELNKLGRSFSEYRQAESKTQPATGVAKAPVAAEGVGAIPENVPTARAPIAQEGVGGGSGVVEPELVGMGGATPSEFAPPKPFKTSNKNATVDAERKARGLEPMMDLERQPNQSAWDSAMRKIDENPQVQDELITELTAQPRALTPEENAMVTHRRVDLRNEYEKSLHRWREAFEGDDMVRAAEESQRVKEWSAKLSDLEDMTKSTGAESGRSLQARKMMAREDFSLAQMELRAMEAKGRNLTPDEHIELIRAQEKMADLQRKLDTLEEGRSTKETDAATTETMTEVAREAPKESKSKDFDVDREDNLLSGIKAKVEKGQQNEITPLVRQLARVFWRRGIRQREPMIDELHGALKTIVPEITREGTQRAFSGYGDYKPLSKAEIDVGLRDLRGQTQQVLKLEALEARKPLEKTGQERRVPSDEERRLIKQVNELKRKYGVAVTDPATQLKSALQSRKTYYEHRIADLNHEIQARQRIVKTKSASPRDAELDTMIAEVERLKAEHEQIFGKREITPEQQLKQAIAAAERNQAHWETRLDNAEKGVFTKQEKGRKVTSAELETIQAQTAAIREHVKELKDLANPKKTKEEIALQSLKTRMATQTAVLKERIAKGDFAKRERKSVPLDAEANRLKAERDLAKEEFQQGLEKDRWNNSTVFEKTKTRTAGVYDLIKTLMSTGEFSFVLRQGKGAFLEALTSPKRAVAFSKAVRDGLRAMQSPLKQRTIEQGIFSDPMYAQALRDKLYVLEHGSKLSKQEEFMMGRYSDAIPGVQAFNRAAETFLKKLRFDNYKLMSKAMTESGTPTPAEGKIIAAFINEQTGRGGLGRAEPAAVALNRVFFSPRYLMSRLQLASGHQLWSGKWNGTGRARKAVAASYARMLMGAAVYYTALYSFFNRDDKAKVEGDFRSSDAGKIRMGDTRLDPMAGIAQVATLGARTVTGEAKDTKGKVFPIVGEEIPFGKDDWVDYAARFGRSKLHPALGGVIDLRMKQNMVGEPATLTSKLTESGPMTYYDIYEALRAQDLDNGTALALLALLGEGLQTYEKKEKKK